MHIVRLVWLIILFLMLPAAAQSDFKIGPDTTLDNLAVAAGQSNFLVVWRDLRNGPTTPRITGAFVSTTGTQTPDFPISNIGGLPLPGVTQHATLASDTNNFLAVWVDNRVGGAGIRGAIVTPQGIVMGGSDFLIAPVASLSNNNPQVAFAAGDYVVAWQDSPVGSASGTQVFYARVSLTGVAAAPVAMPLNSGSTSAGQSLEFIIKGPVSETFLVYQDTAATPPATYGARIAADSTITGTGQVLLFKRDVGQGGNGVPVAVSFDGTQYIILSSYGAQIDSTIFQTRLKLDGTLLRPAGSFAEIAQGATGLPEDSFPRAVFNPSISNVQITPSILNTTGTNEWLFLRNIKAGDTSYHIFIERVLSDSANRDLNPVPLDSATQGILNGATAAVIGTQYLIVWQDGRRPATQPSAGTNVYGVVFDDTQPGDVTRPFLDAVARAGPLSGAAPLAVQFSAGSSTGAVDTLGWDFGDGTTPSIIGGPVHTYTADGTYTAVLSLRKAGYQLHDFILIGVGGTLTGGGGGPPQASAGTLGPVSPGVNAQMLLANLIVAEDFTKTGNDQLHLLGYFDPTVLPVSAAGLNGTLTIGAKSYAFSVDATGKVTAANGAKLAFFINLFTGAFVINTATDDLSGPLSASGALNETQKKPGKDVVLPVSITLGDLSYQANVDGKYISTAGKSGRYEYNFVTSGFTDQGFIHITAVAAVEGGKAPKRVDQFSIAGNIGVGTSYGVTKADTGTWTFSFGNYTESIPVQLLTTTAKSTIYQYKAPASKIGISVFQYDSATGRFLLQFKDLPAEGDTASGFPLTTSVTNRADMALSIDFATNTGTDLQASIYTRFVRKKAGGKNWKLR
jgi:hypothetical protein